MYRSIPHICKLNQTAFHNQPFIMRRTIWGHDLGHTDSLTHTHSHTNKPPTAGVQLVGHTSIKVITLTTFCLSKQRGRPELSSFSRTQHTMGRRGQTPSCAFKMSFCDFEKGSKNQHYFQSMGEVTKRVRSVLYALDYVDNFGWPLVSCVHYEW